jgi:hypothetical protein
VSAPVPFVLFRITSLDEHGPLQLAISERLLEAHRAWGVEQGVVLGEDDTAMAAALDVRGDGEPEVASMNAAEQETFGEGPAVGRNDTLACAGGSVRRYLAFNFVFTVDGGEPLSAPARTLGRGRHIAGCALCDPEEDDSIRGVREIRRVVDIDAERWVAGKQGRRARA